MCLKYIFRYFFSPYSYQKTPQSADPKRAMQAMEVILKVKNIHIFYYFTFVSTFPH